MKIILSVDASDTKCNSIPLPARITSSNVSGSSKLRLHLPPLLGSCLLWFPNLLAWSGRSGSRAPLPPTPFNGPVLLTALPKVLFFKFVKSEPLEGDKFSFGKLIERRFVVWFSVASLDGCRLELIAATFVRESIFRVDGLFGVGGNRRPPPCPLPPNLRPEFGHGLGKAADKRCLL